MIDAQKILALVAKRNEPLKPAQRFAIPPLAWAAQCAAALEAARDKQDVGINSARRVAHFMAQIAHETGGFRSLVESTRYSNPERLDKLFSNVHGLDHAKRLVDEGPQAIGNCIYANKLGNGGIESGDGFRFRGRGFLMNTGRANYAEVKRYSGLDVVADPDMLGRPETAAVAAAAFWSSHHLNAAADADDVDQVTRVVNGTAMEGRANRAAWAVAAKAVWPH